MMAHLERCGVPVRTGAKPPLPALIWPYRSKSVYIDDPDQKLESRFLAKPKDALNKSGMAGGIATEA